MKSNYYKSKESVEEYIKSAKGVDGSQLIEKLNKYLPSGSVLLEIGSGPGTDFKILKGNYSVVGSDYSEEFVSRLINSNKGDEFLSLDAITLDTDKKFHGIYSNKVLQHLTDIELKKSIKRQADILKTDGIICHSFWKGNGDEIFKGMLVNYQTTESIRPLFEDRFEILLIEEYNEFEDGDSLLLIGKKQ